MKILVPIKRVADPDNANKVKVSDDGTELSTAGLEWKLNPFDEWSLEAALRLTENAAEKSRQGEVVLASIGPADAKKTVLHGLAMGAERGILVDAEDNDLDSNVVAQVLHAIAKKEEPTVVFLGKQSADGDSNVAGTKLAELLGWPLVNYAAKISTDDGGETFTVVRELDAGMQTVKVKAPCVFTSSDRILHPEAVRNGITPDDFQYPEAEGGRYTPIKAIFQAKKKPIEETNFGDLGVEPTRTVNYTKFATPPARGGDTEFVESVGELVEKLKNDAKVL